MKDRNVKVIISRTTEGTLIFVTQDPAMAKLLEYMAGQWTEIWEK